VEHSNAASQNRFQKHEIGGKTSLSESRENAGLGQSKSMLGGSLKDQRLEKPDVEPEKTEMKKQIDKIKEALRRAKT
jgi:hypothetical protein